MVDYGIRIVCKGRHQWGGRGEEALSAASLGQGPIILVPDSDKAWTQSQCVCTQEALPVSMETGGRAENQVLKTQDVSCELGALHFTNRTEPGTEKSLIL